MGEHDAKAYLDYVPGEGEQTNLKTWGIDRVDQADLPLNDLYRWKTDGTGVNVFVIDTGIDITHEGFGGRAKFAANCMETPCNEKDDPGDTHGHGTHCAGTVASTLYGVAKNATVWSVNGIYVKGEEVYGRSSFFVRSIEFVTNHPAKSKVISMSLCTPSSDAVDNAVNAAHAANVVLVTGSSNWNNSACYGSPSRAEKSVSAMGSDIRDEKYTLSSWGPCATIYAPAVDIVSLKAGGGTISHSGTSMACPHVAGAIALIRSRDPEITSEAAVAILLKEAIPDKITGNPPDTGTPNLLVQTFVE